MQRTSEQILEAALHLPEKDRQALAHDLLASLPPNPEVEAAWASEIERRIENVRTGKSKLIPAEEVFRQAEDLLR